MSGRSLKVVIFFQGQTELFDSRSPLPLAHLQVTAPPLVVNQCEVFLSVG